MGFAAVLSLSVGVVYVKARPVKVEGMSVYWGQECQLVAPNLYDCRLYRNEEQVGDFEFTIEEAHHFANWLNYHEEEIGKYYCEDAEKAKR